MNAPRVTDTTLRDGSHAMKHQFTREQVQRIVQALDAAGVPVIEVTHGDGVAGSSIQYGFSGTSEIELIETARRQRPFPPGRACSRRTGRRGASCSPSSSREEGAGDGRAARGCRFGH